MRFGARSGWSTPARPLGKHSDAPGYPESVTDEPPPTAPDAASASGIGGIFARHRVGFIVGAVAVGFALLGTGSVFSGVAMASPKRAAPAPSPTPTVIPPRPVPQTVVAATPVRTCSIAKLSRDPRLMSFEGTVALTDGTVLFDRKGATPARTASIMKVFTAAAALAKLGPNYRIPTTVVDGATPGQIVLVGHGDATLSAGQGSVYAGAPRLSDLAKQTIVAYSARHPGVPITPGRARCRLLEHEGQMGSDLEALRAADRLPLRGNRASGGRRPCESARRDQPAQHRPGRSRRGQVPRRPARRRHRRPGLRVRVHGTGRRSIRAAVLGTVRSQPIKTLIPQMLIPSDNTLGEMLARIVSKASGSDGSAASFERGHPGGAAAVRCADDRGHHPRRLGPERSQRRPVGHDGGIHDGRACREEQPRDHRRRLVGVGPDRVAGKPVHRREQRRARRRLGQ